MNKKFTHFFSSHVDQTTGASGSIIPGIPNFSIDRADSKNTGYGKAKVTWKPNFAGTPGLHFFVEHREKGESQYLNSEPQFNDDTIIVGSLEPNKEYEFRVVSVDGVFKTPSASQFFIASGEGETFGMSINSG